LLSSTLPAERRLSFGLPDLRHGPLVLDGGGELFIQTVVEADGVHRLDDVVGQRFLIVSPDSAPSGRTLQWWTAQVPSIVTTAATLPGADQIRHWLTAHKADVAVIRPDRYVMATGRALDEITAEFSRSLLDQDAAVHRGHEAPVVVP
jgi:hypothetical protein